MNSNPNYLQIKNLQFRRECRTFLPFGSHARIVVATIKRRPLVPDTVIETVDASDGIKSTALQAAQRYRQKYRQTARTAIRKAADEMKKPPYCSTGYGPKFANI
jgi:hypothetical protein